MLTQVIDQYPLVNLFLLIVDRDGREDRRNLLDRREEEVRAILSGSRRFLAQEAWQEVEVWALASQELPRAWHWGDVRNDPNPKERYFEALVTERNMSRTLGRGRREIGRDIGRQYSRITSRCPELRELEARIMSWLRE